MVGYGVVLPRAPRTRFFKITLGRPEVVRHLTLVHSRAGCPTCSRRTRSLRLPAGAEVQGGIRAGVWREPACVGGRKPRAAVRANSSAFSVLLAPLARGLQAFQKTRQQDRDDVNELFAAHSAIEVRAAVEAIWAENTGKTGWRADRGRCLLS
jgi:hypothetical protein